MEDAKRDNSTKAKRTKFEHVKQTATAYLQKRNYPCVSYENISLEDFLISSQIDNEISRPNSILYSCFNNDPIVIDQTYTKFILWVKELLKNDKKKYEDLETVVAPMFCHVYLEILRGGHTDRAANFLKVNLSTVDKNRCDSFVQELINAVVNDAVEVPILKDHFRRNKYAVKLSQECIVSLKQFLSEAGHVVLLQVFQSWFIIEEKEENFQEEIDIEQPCIFNDKILCNGHVENSKVNSMSMQRLLQAMENVASQPAPVYSAHLSHVKDNVTCGVLNRQCGNCAYSYNNLVILRSLQTLQQLDNSIVYGEQMLLGHHGRVFDMAFFKPHKHLVSASQDKTLRLFDLKEYALKMTYFGHEYPVYCVCTSVNGNYFASGSYDHTSRLWSVSRKDTLRVFVGHTQQVTSIDFHQNCTYIATGSADKNIRMWSIKDAEPIRLLLGSKATVFSVCFSPKGQYLLSSGEDKRLRVWDLVSAKQLVEFKTGSTSVTKIAISDDEKLIATGAIDGTIKTWNFESLIKTNSESTAVEPIHNFSLSTNLLALDYCFGTFGCLTAQSYTSTQL